MYKEEQVVAGTRKERIQRETDQESLRDAPWGLRKQDCQADMHAFNLLDTEESLKAF